MALKALWEKMHISNDDFIRTTDERHEKVVQELLQKLMKKAIFTRLNMKVGIVHLVKHSGLSKSLVKIIHAQIVAAL